MDQYKASLLELRRYHARPRIPASAYEHTMRFAIPGRSLDGGANVVLRHIDEVDPAYRGILLGGYESKSVANMAVSALLNYAIHWQRRDGYDLRVTPAVIDRLLSADPNVPEDMWSAGKHTSATKQALCRDVGLFIEQVFPVVVEWSRAPTAHEFRIVVPDGETLFSAIFHEMASDR